MPRPLTATATAWRQGGSFAGYDWLVESMALEIHWSYVTTSAGGFTFEHRLLSISEIEHSVPPGGGLASAQSVTVTVIESVTGQSLRGTWDRLAQLEGADLQISLLIPGDTYANRVRVFTGEIDQGAWVGGVSQGGGIGTLTAVSQELHRDIQLPRTVLTRDAYPRLPDVWQGAVLPLIYGTSDKLLVAPMLMLDAVNLIYRVADHPMGLMFALHSPSIPTSARLLPKAHGTVDLATATYTMTTPVPEQQYDIPGITRSISQSLNVTTPANLIDNNVGTSAFLTPTTLDGHGDGIARLGVLYTWPDPTGANAAAITLFEHRRSPAAATTLTAELIVRSVDPVTMTIQRDNLFRDGPYRHSSNPRSREVVIAPITVVPPAGLEVELQAINEGGAGTVAEVWTIAEETLRLYFQADSLAYPVLLTDPWYGRPDPDGSITGTPGFVITGASEVLHSILVQHLGLAIDTAQFTALRAVVVTYALGIYRFDFGLGGGGWSKTQLAATQLLDAIAQQGRFYVFPQGDGTVTANLVRATQTPSVGLTLANTHDVLKVETSRLEQVHSTFEVRYGWSIQLQRYTKVATAHPGGCNHPSGSLAADLLERCIDSDERYHPLSPLIIEAFLIQDDATAFTLLQHLVEYFWTQQFYVTVETTFVGIHLEVGDYVTITHPELPTQVSGTVFEVVRVSLAPEEAASRPWPIRLLCLSPGTLPSFDYFAIKDQNNVVWYWWINRAHELAWSLAPPTLVTRVASDLALNPIPSWLQLMDPASATRYLSPSTFTGEPIVSATLPSVGAGFVGSPTLRGAGRGTFQLDVSEVFEVVVVLL